LLKVKLQVYIKIVNDYFFINIMNKHYEAVILLVDRLADCQTSEKVVHVVFPVISARISAKPKASEPGFDQEEF
jgi:hypothetical protein